MTPACRQRRTVPHQRREPPRRTAHHRATTFTLTSATRPRRRGGSTLSQHSTVVGGRRPAPLRLVPVKSKKSVVVLGSSTPAVTARVEDGPVHELVASAEAVRGRLSVYTGSYGGFSPHAPRIGSDRLVVPGSDTLETSFVEVEPAAEVVQVAAFAVGQLSSDAVVHVGVPMRAPHAGTASPVRGQRAAGDECRAHRVTRTMRTCSRAAAARRSRSVSSSSQIVSGRPSGSESSSAMARSRWCRSRSSRTAAFA